MGVIDNRYPLRTRDGAPFDNTADRTENSCISCRTNSRMTGSKEAFIFRSAKASFADVLRTKKCVEDGEGGAQMEEKWMTLSKGDGWREEHIPSSLLNLQPF